MNLTAVIITHNEERNIGRCLDSLTGVADEVVVVDSFSTDGTESICREKGARFFQHAFDGYAEQKNWADAQAKYPWVLSLDADEALSPSLRASVLLAKNRGSHEAYSMNRLTNYCGQWIRHSGWYPDRKVRLFQREKARWGGPAVHERLLLDDPQSVGFLAGDLLHFSYYTVEEHRVRAARYADLGAQVLFAKGKKAQWWNLVFSPAFKFLRNYMLRCGFLDGRAGWTICRIAALETYWKYRELARLVRAASEQGTQSQ
ncbi:MAG: glycosyltransferase family 2 protein [Saprospiraceae bacterium]